MRNAGILAGALLCGAVMASPAAAADPAGVSAEQPAKPEKLTCRREQRVGTRLAQLICLTKAQWRQRDIAFDEQKRRLQDESDRDVKDRMLPGTPTGAGG